MSFRLSAKANLPAALLEVLSEQLHAMAAKASDGQLTTEARIHAVRLHCKRIRAALNLLPESAEVVALTSWARRTAAGFAAARDARASLACATKLAPRCGDQDALLNWLEALTAAHEAAAEPTLDTLPNVIAEQLHSLAQQPLPEVGLQQLSAAFDASQARIQRAHSRAVRKGKSRHFHHWRTCCKRSSLQGRLLRELLPDTEQAQWHQLQQLLGKEHDCTILLAALKDAPAGLKPASRRLRRAARQQRKALRQCALDFAG